MKHLFLLIWTIFVLAVLTLHAQEAVDIPIADFEGDTYGNWQVEGGAFGTGPEHGDHAGNPPVTGQEGHGFASSLHGTAKVPGKLTSPVFTVQRPFIRFLLGGNSDNRLFVALLVNGHIVRRAEVQHTYPGQDRLDPLGWDVREFLNTDARIQIVDAEPPGNRSHLVADGIAQTATPPAGLLETARREITIEKPWLSFPITSTAKARDILMSVDGQVVRRINVELAEDDQPERWTASDMSPYLGKTVTLQTEQVVPESIHAFASLKQEAAEPWPPNLYHEALRPQFHFSAAQGWLNDPNGLVFFHGQYHLFFQHNPFSQRSGLIHWGHAVSADLVHWTEQPEALYPDADAAIWSGSAVVDWRNTSGFGQDGKPPLVLIYTKAGHNGGASLAHSNDGLHFTKYDGNPVLGDLKVTNRDPKVFWYEPGKHWVLALYVEENNYNNFRFFTSADLRHWTFASQLEGGKRGKNGEPNDNFLYECADLWEMPVEGQPMVKKWVVSGANTEYMIGSFDGKTFTPETPKLPGQRGGGYYAPQTFNEEPRGRRIRIGWFQTAAPGMPFNQSMSLPSEHKLVPTPEGLRLTWSPVEELTRLRDQTFHIGAQTLHEHDANPLADVDADLLEVRAEFTPAKTGKTTFLIRGVPVSYDAARGELTVRDRRVPAPPVAGKQHLIIYADRLSLEVYASDGLIYVPLPVEFKPGDHTVSVAVEEEPVSFDALDAYRLRSAWTAAVYP